MQINSLFQLVAIVLAGLLLLLNLADAATTTMMPSTSQHLTTGQMMVGPTESNMTTMSSTMSSTSKMDMTTMTTTQSGVMVSASGLVVLLISLIAYVLNVQ